MNIRTATMQDLDQVSELEALCFPPAEAAPRKALAERLDVYPDCFWLLYENGALAAMVNGMATHQPDLTDDLYKDSNKHHPHGAWQMIFGVATHPAARRKGYAAQVLNRAIADSRTRGRKGLVLTCKEHLLHYYAKFGFVSEGKSVSTHGGAVWYQMRLTF